jgi:hypothetical protein
MLTSDVAAFLQSGLCIHIGTRNDRLEPTGVLVAAAVVDADRTHLTVFLPKAGADDVVANLEANGQAALCFARPVDDRACQVKGVFVGMRAASKKERAIVGLQWEGCLQQLEQVGIPRALWAGHVVWPCLAVRVRTTAVFDQTPGPAAGVPLA